MEFLTYFTLPESQRCYWTDRIAEGDWRAAPYLADHLRKETFQQNYGPNGQVLLLTDGDNLISFCTLVPQDEIVDDTLLPWIGFVYTFPKFRGHRYSEQIIDYACSIAKAEGYSSIYVSSNEEGLYEKYGFTFWKPRTPETVR